jgi:hypothetical protein
MKGVSLGSRSRSRSHAAAGSGILTAALASPLVSGVTVISRKPPYITHPKLTTILLAPPDYPEGFDAHEVPPSLLERLKGHSAVIWALGISQTQVNQQDYIKWVERCRGSVRSLRGSFDRPVAEVWLRSAMMLCALTPTPQDHP